MSPARYPSAYRQPHRWGIDAPRESPPIPIGPHSTLPTEPYAMPNPLLKDKLRCSSFKADGSPCGSVRRKGLETCLFHSPQNPELEARRRRDELARTVAADPSSSLDALMSLDPTDPLNLQRIRIGLMRHVAAGAIEHQAASACLRFAQAAFDARATDRGASSMSAKLRAQLLSKDDPATEPAEGGGGGESRAGRDQ